MVRRRKMTNLLFLFYLFGLCVSDPVYVRSGSGSFGQIVTSSTLRWTKGRTEDSATLSKSNSDHNTFQQAHSIICRIPGVSSVGLVDKDSDECVVHMRQEEESRSRIKVYQTISAGASRLIWVEWRRPNSPPAGAIAVSLKPSHRFIASDPSLSKIGFMDPKLNLGSAIFPDSTEGATSSLILTEIEPERYEMGNVDLSRIKGFIEEEIVLAVGHLKNEERSEEEYSWEEGKEKVESILSYEINVYDYWGQGNLMAKGLHTSIALKNETKIIEWGIPYSLTGFMKTMEVSAHLAQGTGVNLTIKGMRTDGEMSYGATLKTLYKDGSSSSRWIEGHRKLKEVNRIRLVQSKPYFLSNGSGVPEPTTTTTTTTTTSTSTSTTTTTLKSTMEDTMADTSERGTSDRSSQALPIESKEKMDNNDMPHSGGKTLNYSPLIIISCILLKELFYSNRI